MTRILTALAWLLYLFTLLALCLLELAVLLRLLPLWAMLGMVRRG